MNEITLSNNLAQIELEITHHKQIAGQSIWEIGQTIAFPMEKILSVRSAASGISMSLDRKYMVRSDRDTRTVIVTREK